MINKKKIIGIFSVLVFSIFFITTITVATQSILSDEEREERKSNSEFFEEERIKIREQLKKEKAPTLIDLNEKSSKYAEEIKKYREAEGDLQNKTKKIKSIKK